MKLVTNNVTAIKPKALDNNFTLYDFINSKGDHCKLTSKEACKGIGIFGSTGSGKTKSLLFPMFQNLLKAKSGGFVLDVKGDLHITMKLLARRCGMEDRIKVIGLNEDAESYNLMSNFNNDSFRAFLEGFSNHEGKGEYFFKQGISNLIDVIEFDLLLTKATKRFTKHPSFKLYLEYLTVPSECKNMQIKFSKLVGNSFEGAGAAIKNKIRCLYYKIRADRFHFFNIFNEFNSVSEDDQQQKTWRLDLITSTLSLLCEDEIEKKLSDARVKESLGDLILDQKKIVIFVGDVKNAFLSKHICNALRHCLYTDIISQNIEDISTTPTFLMIDEYSQFFNANANVMSDEDFTSLCRSFNVISIFGTQSISSLLRYAKNKFEVTMIMSNLVNKIFLQTDDQETYNYAKELFEYDSVSLADIPTKSLVAQRGQKVGLAKISTSEGVEFQSFAPILNESPIMKYLLSDELELDLIDYRKKKNDKKRASMDSFARKAGFNNLEHYENWIKGKQELESDNLLDDLSDDDDDLFEEEIELKDFNMDID
jgi:hypothetical protein